MQHSRRHMFSGQCDGDRLFITLETDSTLPDTKESLMRTHSSPVFELHHRNINQRFQPDLEKINASVQEAGKMMQADAEKRTAYKKALKDEIRKLSDHELNVFINLTRMRMNTLSGGKDPFDHLAAMRYELALQERIDRRNRKSNNGI